MPAPVIDEIQLDPEIGYGAVASPMFATKVIVTGAGAEQRIGLWSGARRRYVASLLDKTPAQHQALLAFWYARQGRLRGFRFKDFSDYTAQTEDLTVTGAPTVQLTKRYTSGAVTHTRTITKPVAGVTMRRGGSAFSAFTLDTTTGIATLTADSTQNIVAITQANPGVVTATDHGFSTGNVIYLSGIGGMTQLNGQTVTITVIDPNSFSIGVNTTGYSAYTSGGTAAKYVQPSEDLEWSGEFDVPVRFDMPDPKFTSHNPSQFSFEELAVVELLA